MQLLHAGVATAFCRGSFIRSAGQPNIECVYSRLRTPHVSLMQSLRVTLVWHNCHGHYTDGNARTCSTTDAQTKHVHIRPPSFMDYTCRYVRACSPRSSTRSWQHCARSTTVGRSSRVRPWPLNRTSICTPQDATLTFFVGPSWHQERLCDGSQVHRYFVLTSLTNKKHARFFLNQWETCKWHMRPLIHSPQTIYRYPKSNLLVYRTPGFLVVWQRPTDDNSKPVFY